MKNRILKRAIPSSGEMLPVIGLGTWQQFDIGADKEERDNLHKVLQLMAAHGGTVLDSSPMYGRAEQVIGDITGGMAEKDMFFYATKVWTSGEQNGIKQMQDSMRKMRREVLDLIQIHNLLDWQTHLRTLRKWKEEGKVRYIGITHYQESAHTQLEKIIKSEPLDFVQFNYSIRVRGAEKSLLNAAAEKGVAVIINEPLEKGSLFSAVKGKELPPWAKDNDINNWTEFFLKYILAHPAVTCIIPGTSSPQNIVANMRAGEGAVPDEAIRKKMVEWMKGVD